MRYCLNTRRRIRNRTSLPNDLLRSQVRSMANEFRAVGIRSDLIHTSSNFDFASCCFEGMSTGEECGSTSAWSPVHLPTMLRYVAPKPRSTRKSSRMEASGSKLGLMAQSFPSPLGSHCRNWSHWGRKPMPCEWCSGRIARRGSPPEPRAPPCPARVARKAYSTPRNTDRRDSFLKVFIEHSPER